MSMPRRSVVSEIRARLGILPAHAQCPECGAVLELKILPSGNLGDVASLGATFEEFMEAFRNDQVRLDEPGRGKSG